MSRPLKASGASAADREGARLRFLDTFLLYQLSIAAGNSDKLLTRILDSKLKLSLAEWRVILMIGEAPRLSTDALAARTTMDKARVSRAIALLVAAGLLDREVQDHDRRLIALSLTSRGRTVFEASISIGEKAEKQLLRRLTKQERSTLFEILVKLSEPKPTFQIVQS